ncbi:hypothetical protein SAMN05444280_12528 [Tangfeifania diversioriginum]|uniref:Uncharacterized protein n=1 Tax=Tangfeifania diversioriginum TaxID=1168035 RepID=A0A1M6L137_9BACT|nr:hypothetical protein SAMN05444280_12528 [Tangfeifania diversioriginum]
MKPWFILLNHGFFSLNFKPDCTPQKKAKKDI